MPAFSNKGATFFKYTSLASPFLLLGFITTFSLRGLLGIPKQEKKKKKKKEKKETMIYKCCLKFCVEDHRIVRILKDVYCS